MRCYWRLRRWIQKWKAIHNAPLIMLLSERSVISNMNLEDLTWTPNGDGTVIGVHFIKHQPLDKDIIRITTEDTDGN